MSLSRTALGVLAAVAAATTVQLSGATFSTESTSRGMLGASPDWTVPVVAVPGATGLVSGTTTITMTASDVDSVVRDVRLEFRAAGSAGAWTTICTATTAPYSCAWATAALPDGGYELRAVATDTYGNAATSASVVRTADNRGPVVLIDENAMPADLRGTAQVLASATDAGSGVASVTIQWLDKSTWVSLCTDTTAPYACSWATPATGDYSVRAVAVDSLGNSTTSATVLVSVDNTNPTVTMASPGSLLAGTVSLTATTSDADSGVASVLLEYRASATGPWVPVCTVTTSPYTCRWDTTKVADGTTYAFRATSTDAAGNASVSATTVTSTVDNRAASVSVEDPGAFLRGTVAVLANANAPGGVTSVTLQYAPTGTTTWTTICVDTTAPYSCDWDTTKVPSGKYDLRAVLTPVTGAQVVSATVVGRTVDNAPLRAHDVQVANGGQLGRVDAGDMITFTYDGVVDPTTLAAGWTGAARPVAVRLRDGGALGGAGGEDVLDVLTSTATNAPAVALGTVNTRGNYVKGQGAVLTATMTASTVTVNGLPATQVVLRLEAVSSGSANLRTAKGSRTMQWSPSTAARGTSGLAVAATPVDELGTLDRDF